MNTFDPSKPYTLRNGCNAVILRSFKDSYVGYWIDRNGREEALIWNIEGSCKESPFLSLINIKQKKVVFLNIYEPNESYMMHVSRWDADLHGSGRTACIRLEYEEGQGL